MNQITDVKQLGKILGIWAHPDDETWASAGVMSAAVANGQSVACVVATHGDAGKTANEKKWPQQHLSKIRRQELNKALGLIGVDDCRILNYDDGQLINNDSKKAIAELRKIIDELKPDTILTFEPNGITGHDDHCVISAWSVRAAGVSKVRPVVYGACETTERYKRIGRLSDEMFKIYFNTKKPFTIQEKEAGICFRLSPSQSKRKLAALKAYQSQTAKMFNTPQGSNFLNDLADTECFIRLY